MAHPHKRLITWCWRSRCLLAEISANSSETSRGNFATTRRKARRVKTRQFNIELEKYSGEDHHCHYPAFHPPSSAPLPIYIFWKTCWATHHRTAHHIVLNYRIIHTEFRISRASKFCICRTCCNATWDAVATIHAQHTNVSEKIPRP
jgi:hypothetical protein